MICSAGRLVTSVETRVETKTLRKKREGKRGRRSSPVVWRWLGHCRSSVKGTIFSSSSSSSSSSTVVFLLKKVLGLRHFQLALLFPEVLHRIPCTLPHMDPYRTLSVWVLVPQVKCHIWGLIDNNNNASNSNNSNNNKINS